MTERYRSKATKVPVPPRRERVRLANTQDDKSSAETTTVDTPPNLGNQEPKKSRKGIGGRPALYRPEYTPIAEKLARLRAMTDTELAEIFDVNSTTILDWKVRYPEFASAVKLGKANADGRVEDALFHRAVGYTYVLQETKHVRVRGELKSLRVEKTTHMPPDVGAIAIWLFNRRPDIWKTVNRVEHTGAGGGPMQTMELELDQEALRSFTPEELKIAERMLKKLAGQKLPEGSGQSNGVDPDAYGKTLN